MYQMIGSSDHIMSVGFDALDRIVLLELMLLLHLLEHGLIVRHFLFAREETGYSLFFVLGFKPGVRSNVFYRETSVRVRI